MNHPESDSVKDHPLFAALREREEARSKPKPDESLRRWRIHQSAQWLREEIHQFLSPKENGLALKLVDILEKEVLGE